MVFFDTRWVNQFQRSPPGSRGRYGEKGGANSLRNHFSVLDRERTQQAENKRTFRRLKSVKRALRRFLQRFFIAKRQMFLQQSLRNTARQRRRSTF